jgi:photosystem II stability/assembly factor-like uncharacterized protein
MLLRFAADPHQSGHLLTALVNGLYGIGTGFLYGSSDYGASWQAITLPQEVAWISSIVFDPETPGLVYLATGGTGVYRSIDSGTVWHRIDDPEQEGMLYGWSITIATHPQHILVLGTVPNPYRSVDGGTTWTMAQRVPEFASEFLFADRDSSRLYIATVLGIFISNDAGDTWTQVPGALGRLQIQALGYGTAADQTILYAATIGGILGEENSLAVDMHRRSSATRSNLVGAGIYRYVQHTRWIYLPLAQR